MFILYSGYNKSFYWVEFRLDFYQDGVFKDCFRPQGQLVDEKLAGFEEVSQLGSFCSLFRVSTLRNSHSNCLHT